MVLVNFEVKLNSMLASVSPANTHTILEAEQGSKSDQDVESNRGLPYERLSETCCCKHSCRCAARTQGRLNNYSPGANSRESLTIPIKINHMKFDEILE